MAEFVGQKKPDPVDGMANMGKPIPLERRDRALKHLRAMGVHDTGQATACIDTVANRLERDEPYKAMEAGMMYLDLTGTYRLFAVLLTDEQET